MHLDVNGTQLWFDVDGPALVPDGGEMRQRPTVVLLDGGAGGFDHSYFKPDFARLADHAQVVYLDLRGHGRSVRGGPDGWSLEACADDVRAFCDIVGIERPIVFGHSMGGPGCSTERDIRDMPQASSSSPGSHGGTCRDSSRASAGSRATRSRRSHGATSEASR
jgi:hypothetical protein